MSLISNVGHALSDDTRLRILAAALTHPEISVGELAALVGYAQSTTSMHVAALRDGGLLETRRRGRRTVVLARHDRWRVIRDACAFCFRRSLASLSP
jgi:DNA-binding transcriptional ArsR family regulator